MYGHGIGKEVQSPESKGWTFYLHRYRGSDRHLHGPDPHRPGAVTGGFGARDIQNVLDHVTRLDSLGWFGDGDMAVTCLA